MADILGGDHATRSSRPDHPDHIHLYGSLSEFFLAVVMLKTTSRYTLPIGLLFFDSEQGQETTLLMAAVAMSVLPMLAVFVFLQKHLVKGIQLGGVKG